MRKFIITAIGALALTGAIASTASADVARCEASITTGTSITTAMFTMNQPANDYRQWSNVWKHDFTVTVNPATGSFVGVGVQTGHDSNGDYTGNWTVTGQFSSVVNGASNTVSLVATRDDGLVLTLDNETMGDDIATTVTSATFNREPLTLPVGEVIEEKTTAPVFATETTTTPGTESLKNHGQFVKAQGGGKVAAQACDGMPVVSTQGKVVVK